MPVHPDTGIVYGEGAANSTFVIRTSGVLTHMNAPWGRLDGAPQVGGLPDNQEWFIKLPPDKAARDALDHRYSIESVWAPRTYDPPRPEGYPTGEYFESITGVLRQPGELKAQVDIQKMAANEACYPPADKDAQEALVADALGRTTRTEVDEVILARHNARIAAMRDNEERAIALYADIDAGRPYDILAGWTYAPTIPA